MDDTTSLNKPESKSSMDLDQFLSQFLVPPPPAADISFGMGVRISSKASKSSLNFDVALPPPLRQQKSSLNMDRLSLASPLAYEGDQTFSPVGFDFGLPPPLTASPYSADMKSPLFAVPQRDDLISDPISSRSSVHNSSTVTTVTIKRFSEYNGMRSSDSQASLDIDRTKLLEEIGEQPAPYPLELPPPPPRKSSSREYRSVKRTPSQSSALSQLPSQVALAEEESLGGEAISVTVYVYSVDGRCISVPIKTDTTVDSLKKEAADALRIEKDLHHFALVSYEDNFSKRVVLKGTATYGSLSDNGRQRLQIRLERVVPETFKSQIQMEDGELCEIEASFFTTAKEAIQKVLETMEYSEDLGSDEKFCIYKLPLDGDTPRYIKDNETPFFPDATACRFILKRKSDDDEFDEADTKVYSLQFVGGFSRNIQLPKNVEASECIQALSKSLGLSAKGLETYKLGLVDDKFVLRYTYAASERLEEELSRGSLCVLNNQGKPLYIGNLHQIVSDSAYSQTLTVSAQALHTLPNHKDLRSVLKSLQGINTSQTSIESSEENVAASGVELTNRIADLLGVSENMAVQDVESRLQKLYGKETALSPSSTDEDAKSEKEMEHEKKRIKKLTTMLGIDSERELAKLLIETKKAAQSEGPEKAVSGLSKLLGINDTANKDYASRRVTMGSPLGRKKDSVSSAESLDASQDKRKGSNVKKIFNRESSTNSEASSPRLDTPIRHLESNGTKPAIVNGQFTCRVYLINQTFKSLSLPADMAADGLITLLVERMNIKEDPGKYGIYEIKRGKERQLAPNEKLINVINAWEGQEVLLFRRKSATNRRGSEDSMASSLSMGSDRTSKNKTLQRTIAARRAAKVANMLGVNERKSELQADNPEIKTIVDMLNNMNNSPTEKGQTVNVEHIYKDGWLVKEEMLGRGKTYWCYVENSTFYAVNRAHQEKELAAFKIALKNYTVKKNMQKKYCIELIPKEGLLSYIFSADSQKACNEWYDAIMKSIKHEEESIVVHKQAETKPQGQDEPQMTMGDFEIHRVLGKGKFGKVLLCSQKSTGKVYAVKVIKKSTINDQKQLTNAQNENIIMRSISHPFIVQLHYAFQTPDKLFLVMDYVNGGELFFHVSHFGRFSEDRVRFYAAEILSALQCLHGKGIVYRDLKLENLLLDRDGHIKLTDFGLSRHEDEIDENESTIAGTFEYLAPEVISGHPHTQMADYWSFGLVIFEMLCGFHPFYCDEREEALHRILYWKIGYPTFVSPDAESLISQLLIRDPTKRLGNNSSGGQIQNHPFFQSINFDALFRKEIEPPFKPDVSDDFDRNQMPLTVFRTKAIEFSKMVLNDSICLVVRYGDPLYSECSRMEASVPPYSVQLNLEPTDSILHLLKQVAEHLQLKYPSSASAEFSMFGASTRIPGIGRYVISSFGNNSGIAGGLIVSDHMVTVSDLVDAFGRELFVHWIDVECEKMESFEEEEGENQEELKLRTKNLEYLQNMEDRLRVSMTGEQTLLQRVAKDFFHETDEAQTELVKVHVDFTNQEYEKMLCSVDLEDISNDDTLILNVNNPLKDCGIFQDNTIPLVRRTGFLLDVETDDKSPDKRLIIYSTASKIQYFSNLFK